MNSEARGQRRSARDSQADTKAALLRGARTCVAQHGLAKTTSRMIATAAGANLASITYYFGSKDELLGEALFGELSERIGPVLALLEDGEATAPTRLTNAVQALVVGFEAARGELPVFLHALMEAAEPGPVGDSGRRLLTSLQHRLAAVITDLKRSELIAPWVEPEAMAALLVATGHGLALHAYLHPEGPALTDLTGQFAALLLSAATPVR